MLKITRGVYLQLDWKFLSTINNTRQRICTIDAQYFFTRIKSILMRNHLMPQYDVELAFIVISIDTVVRPLNGNKENWRKLSSYNFLFELQLKAHLNTSLYDCVRHYVVFVGQQSDLIKAHRHSVVVWRSMCCAQSFAIDEWHTMFRPLPTNWRHFNATTMAISRLILSHFDRNHS